MEAFDEKYFIFCYILKMLKIFYIEKCSNGKKFMFIP